MTLGKELRSDPASWRERFLALQAPEDLGSLLEVPLRQLQHIVRSAHLPGGYRTFDVPKKSGGTRSISAPRGSMGIVQKKLCRVLQSAYVPKPSVHGFVPGRSVKTNADQHIGRAHVLCIDIEDFFPSITARRVFGMLRAVPYSLPPPVANLVTQIVTVDDALPQGAPTSPVISNMLCARMDSQLQKLAREHKCWYSRYGDDMTFSCGFPNFPAALAELVGEPGNVAPQVGNDLRRVIEDNGFSLQEAKTRLQGRKHRQVVTGIKVNVKTNVRRRYVRQLRAMIHALSKWGADAALAEYLSRWSGRSRRTDAGFDFVAVILGKLGFLSMVRGRDDPLVRKLYDRLLGALAEDDPRRSLGAFRPAAATLEPEDYEDACIYVGSVCRDDILKLELRLRTLFARALHAQYAEQWVEQVRRSLGEEEWEVIERRIKDGHRPQDVLHLTDLKHLQKLLGDFWGEGLSAVTRMRKREFNQHFDIVIRVRTAAMHGRPPHLSGDLVGYHRAICACHDLWGSLPSD